MDGEMHVEDSLPNISFGKVIREFFRELFGSRLVALLELDLLRLRQDMDARLQDKDRVIASLREDIQRLNSKVTTYELTIMPHASRMGADVVNATKTKPTKPTFAFEDLGPAKSKWQAVQEAHDAQMRKELAEEAEKEKAAATA